ADVVGRGAKALGRLALGRVAPTPAGHEPFTLAEVLVFRTRAVATSPVAPAAAAIALAPPAQVFPRPLRFVHRPHLVESPLHRVGGAVWLASLDRLHAFHRAAAPVVAAFSAEPLHLLEELTQLLRRDLVRPQAAGQRLRFAEHHLVLVVREV